VVDEWFRSSLNDNLHEMLSDERSLMFGLLKPEPVRELLGMHTGQGAATTTSFFSV
jgi:hypothetical protein